jgi:hypothetical protein
MVLIMPRRFSLGMLLLCVAAIGAGARVAALLSRNRCAEIRVLTAWGCEVTYNYQYDAAGRFTGHPPRRATWLERLFWQEAVVRPRTVAFPKGFTPTPDRVVRSLARLDSVIEVDVMGHSLTDEQATVIAGLTHLRILDLTGARISDAGVAGLRELREANVISLRGTNVTAAGIASIGSLGQLESLDLSCSMVRDDVIPALAAFPGLKYLAIDQVEITDSGLLRLAALKGLKRVSVRGTPVSAKAVAELRAAAPGLEVEASAGEELRFGTSKPEDKTD